MATAPNVRWKWAQILRKKETERQQEIQVHRAPPADRGTVECFTYTGERSSSNREY